MEIPRTCVPGWSDFRRSSPVRRKAPARATSTVSPGSCEKRSSSAVVASLADRIRSGVRPSFRGGRGRLLRSRDSGRRAAEEEARVTGADGGAGPSSGVEVDSLRNSCDGVSFPSEPRWPAGFPGDHAIQTTKKQTRTQDTNARSRAARWSWFGVMPGDFVVRPRERDRRCRQGKNLPRGILPYSNFHCQREDYKIRVFELSKNK